MIQPGSSTEIIKAIHWMKDKNLKKMGQEGLALYKKEFSEKVVYHQLLDLYTGESMDSGHS